MVRMKLLLQYARVERARFLSIFLYSLLEYEIFYYLG
uniref:Uncharacterized protein n=1 Tax=Siphoviridae sp. ctzpQ31 TaxID=2823613 RepID=A0A8S5L8D3_9CAUD|nr:MAG TPA: hypothetical protein [Siphoviridae sp. ctzpQ31]DAE56515.1 MAG TPA: hypothetical protein [Caudoviricetes sp.]DAQ88709.1 MAG TPA: hypothetical protein [Caudoviricetes sp.]DAT11945.1 MAG TPA: hypothetical protein [Bacteriophage sp.]DAY03686.1 MAG TPA: hypothetical protein [Bacteriophage sp.]